MGCAEQQRIGDKCEVSIMNESFYQHCTEKGHGV